MTYGTLKIDTITFTDDGIDKSVSVSGLVQNPSFSGNITATGTISGNIVRGQTISGVTVTGTTAAFTSGTFISLTGTTTQGTTATYTTGSFTSLTGTTISGTTAIYTTGTFTSLTGTTTTGTTANFVSGVFSTQISGATITGTTAAFTTVTGGVATITSGVFALGTNSLPSISFSSDPNTGIYSPGADQVAISTSGTRRINIDSSGRLLVGTPSARTDLIAGTRGGQVQIEAASSDAATAIDKSSLCLTAGNSTSSGGSAYIFFTRTRSDSLGGVNTVSNNDVLGGLYFQGTDGTDAVTAALIKTELDGDASANDMPGRLVFSTTADGASSPTEAMRINNAGELLVGYTSDNGAYKLQVNSQIFATSATIATSDGRYKENVATLDGCVDLVKALRPVSFDWKHQEPITRIDEEGETVVVREAHNFPDGTQVGFIAQEVETVFADKPWLSSIIKQNVRPAVTDNDGNELAPEEEFLGIAEGNLMAVLTSALKDAIGRIESLEIEVAALKA